MMNRVARITPRSAQYGQIALVLVVTLVLGAAAIFYGLTTATPPELERDRKTTAALAQAKAALIGYAVAVTLDGTISERRPGDLPCPDDNDSGSTASDCGNAAGTSKQAQRIGRLPWKTLGLPDLRDGDGERLWYAVSNNFKYNTRTTCKDTNPDAATCLNSDTRGTITIRDSNGTIVNDAGNTDPAASGVIAVIFSAGGVLRRQDGTVQNRSCTGGSGCTVAGVCNGTSTPKCDPVNYLDNFGGTEDNASFSDSNASNGFIKGPIRDANGNVIVNDRLLVITYQDLMPLLEKRVSREILKCLSSYTSANNGRYPWAAPVADVTPPFEDAINTLFGRIPDQPLTQSKLGTISSTSSLQTDCLKNPTLCMSGNWPSSCALPVNASNDSWWNNWKLHVFYSVADAYKPGIGYTQSGSSITLVGGITAPAGCPTCLTVNPPSAVADKQVTVLVAGRRLPAVASGQPRTATGDRQNAANYLEGENNNSDSMFTQQSRSTTFNDTVVFLP